MNIPKIPYWAKIIVSILICNGVGVLGSIVTLDAIPGWYAQLNKPSFNPPGWVFGPVWTVLYTLMGISAAAIWEAWNEHPEAKDALIVFVVQLALNSIWSFLFFGYKNPFFAFIEIICLLILIGVTIFYFRKIKPWAAWLLIPYLLWVAFATILNLSIYLLN